MNRLPEDNFEDERILLENLRWFLKEEFRVQYERLSNQWQRPLSNRISSGRAIEGVRIDKVDSEGTLTLFCEHNESIFREGDTIVLHKKHPEDSLSLQAYLVKDDNTELTARVTGNSIDLISLNTQTHWIIDEGMVDVLDYYLDTLDHVAISQKGKTQILPLLMAKLDPIVDQEKYLRSWEQSGEAGLNDMQQEAVAMAVATNLAHLIIGPPGTGKTFVLAEICKQLVDEGKRVLITGLTHRAVNNALNKIFQLYSDLPVFKIGNERRADDLKVPNFGSFHTSDAMQIKGGYAIGATPFALRTKRLKNVEFDVIIFDEASQITLPLAIMGMLAGEKYIFIGDDNQLPPINVLDDREMDDPLYGASVFEYLCDRGYETTLETTYRMNDVLTKWPSKTFYGGHLRSSDMAKNLRIKYITEPHPIYKPILTPESPLVFVNIEHMNTRTKSYQEADLISTLVLELLRCGIKPEEIGVVSPYRSQCRLIKSYLRKTLSYDDLGKIVIDTVERMQGQEREVILVSFTTSDKDFLEIITSFFYQPERLNVTITRPKTKLIMVGSRHMLNIGITDPELKQWLDNYKDLFTHCKELNVPTIHG
ncbi:MAG: AAA family ATPase [Anaerolineaceae bacterium]|nr:AAA family ATPase [Anaerolineaceae bacterium]